MDDSSQLDLSTVELGDLCSDRRSHQISNPTRPRVHFPLPPFPLLYPLPSPPITTSCTPRLIHGTQ
ncbi:hypothetical protein ACN4EG_04555 [Alkalinema pantanalense CENA528]|uniref:hypothetical protein n=1 Tax=Alkalinema pantanalense TaxID=1620705 RepID=UPI003D6E6EE9